MTSESSKSKPKLTCPTCGYNLTLLTTDRCPECGNTFLIAPPTQREKRHPFRYLGEFVGHIWKGVRAHPSKSKHVLRTDVQEERHGDITLRRTTIEEIELKDTERRT